MKGKSILSQTRSKIQICVVFRIFVSFNLSLDHCVVVR